jgi:hypothetical protein
MMRTGPEALLVAGKIDARLELAAFARTEYFEDERALLEDADHLALEEPAPARRMGLLHLFRPLREAPARGRARVDADADAPVVPEPALPGLTLAAMPASFAPPAVRPAAPACAASRPAPPA